MQTRMTPPWGMAVLAVAAIWPAFVPGAIAQGSVAGDRAALVALYDATSGSGWANRTNWKTSAPLGTWYGVTTNAEGRVTALRLRGNGLAGHLPAALGNLSRLATLYLSGNELTGGLPDELGKLNLWGLGLSGNELRVGPLPTWLGNQTSMRWLYLSKIGLTGPIDVLARLVNLETLYLNGNDLTGSPDALGALTRLEGLLVDENGACRDLCQPACGAPPLDRAGHLLDPDVCAGRVARLAGDNRVHGAAVRDETAGRPRRYRRGRCLHPASANGVGRRRINRSRDRSHGRRGQPRLHVERCPPAFGSRGEVRSGVHRNGRRHR